MVQLSELGLGGKTRVKVALETRVQLLSGDGTVRYGRVGYGTKTRFIQAYRVQVRTAY